LKWAFANTGAAKIKAEFDDAWVEKLKKIELPQHRFSLTFHKT